MVGTRKKGSARKTRWLFAALACALLLVVVVVGLFLWAPWEAGQVQTDSSGSTEESALVATSEESQSILQDDVIFAEQDTSSSLLESFAKAQEKRQDLDVSDIPEAYREVREKNSDVCGWLYVPGTNVSLAIARNEDDDGYYMWHGASGGVSVFGSAYMESLNAADFSDPVTVLYGHSFSDASIMFTELSKFNDLDFLNENGAFFIFTPDAILGYRIVSACVYSDEHILKTYDFSDTSVLQDYFDSMAVPEFGAYLPGYSLDAQNDRIVQLSTCTIPAREGLRYLVTGVFVGERDYEGSE